MELHSAPSSSGLGRLVLIQKIAGSTPAGVTKNESRPEGSSFVCGRFCKNRGREAGSLVVGVEQKESKLSFSKRRPTN